MSAGSAHPLAPRPTPFYPRQQEHCHSREWKNWAGWICPVTYEHSHEAEYWAIRNSAALIDVTPLFKYELRGPDALRVADRIMTRKIASCQVGRVMYSPWCDEQGKMIEDGTVARLSQDHLRLTAAERSLRWFEDVGYGLEFTIEDVTEKLAALSLQGPRARRVLCAALGQDLAGLGWFRLAATHLPGREVGLAVTRTGYTGDLGYELWIEAAHALDLWDLLMQAGRPYGLRPCGLAAMDIARIEAGLLLIDVDFIPSNKAVLETQKSSPFEAGLGWSVALDKPDFIGRSALLEEKRRGSRWALVGLEIDWVGLERVFAGFDLPPQVAGRASRDPVPVYKAGRQIGQATSRTFSPRLKKYIGLATLEARHAHPGVEVEIEVTVEYTRLKAPAKVAKTPFFDPPRKRSNPGGGP
ncbi:MAG TPA: aminomethyltransferase family protein [Acidobacteriota bacterium]|nr:aminomethyltransferase family protein [Acidobacteriota bacterium]